MSASPSAPRVPAVRPGRAAFRALSARQLAAHLLAAPTVSDRAWTAVPRLPGETRPDFVRRVVRLSAADVEAAVASAPEAGPSARTVRRRAAAARKVVAS